MTQERRRFYEVIPEWSDTSTEPLEYDYSEAGLRAACDEYHAFRQRGDDASVWLVRLDEESGERDEELILSPKGENS